ncbi:MAG: thioredoxin domain-containing protein [Desulfobacterales bacterium]
MGTASNLIVPCPSCGAKNRIPAERMGSPEARCGRCRQALFSAHPGEGKEGGAAYALRCAGCGTKNRIPPSKIDSAPRCGRCGAPLPAGELRIARPVAVSDADFEERVLKAPLPVLLFAWAPWCPSCQAAAPGIDRLAARMQGRLRVAQVNVEANPETASRLGILSVPFLFVFDRGELRESIPGAPPAEELALRLSAYLG